MKIIRTILGNIILFFDALFSPKAIKRSEEEQARLDALTQNMALYQFKMCPFCVKIRRVIKRQNLNIEIRDAIENAQYGEELVKGGGKRQVPCLRIDKEDGTTEWMYESDVIKQYLESL